MDVAVAAVLLEQDGAFALKGGHRTALQVFLVGKDVLSLLATRFGKS